MKQIPNSVTGILREYLVQPGDTISVGQEVAIVESMKMMIPVLAEIAGTVRALLQTPNATIQEGDALVELE